MSIEKKLEELRIIIPIAIAPIATYKGFIKTNNLVFISGQLPIVNGKVVEGKLGSNIEIPEAKEAAKICAINILAQLKEACDGDLNRVEQCVKLGIFVNSTDDFTEQPSVANGASDLIVEIFGEAGKHSRAAVGVAQLPRNAAVEIEAIFEVK